MPEYTAAAAIALLAVVAAELAWFRSGVLRMRAFWISLAICLFFMVLMNGWLTKLSAPIVLYDAAAKTPWRFPWDIPVEDYLFGVALITLVTALWVRQGRAAGDDDRRDREFPVDRELPVPVGRGRQRIEADR